MVVISRNILFFLASISSVCCSNGAYNESVTNEIEVCHLPEKIEDEQSILSEFRTYFEIELLENRLQRKPWIEASRPENLNKSRYATVLPYDETRVILGKLPEDPYSDFINANYIDGFNREQEYVATQGPLNYTINDFWRMIWMLHAEKIVMLTKLWEGEKEKSAKYWPATAKTYGDIRVVKTSEFIIENDQVIRTFIVMKDSEERIVRQFHYTAWPDMGVPENRRALINIMRQARKYGTLDNVPMVVHCSAGIGRTGTGILIDSMIERGQSEDKVDFLKRLNRMRDHRIELVEKEAQYYFAYEGVNDYFNDNCMKEYLSRMDKEYEIADPQDNAIPPDYSFSTTDYA